MVIESNKVSFTYTQETFLLPGLYIWDFQEFHNQAGNSVFLSRDNYKRIKDLFKVHDKLEVEIK